MKPANLAWRFVTAAVVLVPLFVWSGADSFRLPKTALFVTLIAAMLIISAAAYADRFPDVFRQMRASKEVLVGLAILTWLTIVTITSTNVGLSGRSLLVSACLLAFFTAAYLGASSKGVGVMGYVFVPSAINALVVILQQAGLWNPFVFTEGVSDHTRSTGLLGNPDYVGTYLVAPALAAAALATQVESRLQRALFGVLTAVLVAGILASRTFTALAAVSAGALALIILTRRFRLLAILLLLAGAAVIVDGALRTKLRVLGTSLAAGDLEIFFSGRLGTYITAWEMFKDHPILGVGPGCFGFHYFDYRLAVDAAYSALLKREVAGVNFGEAHNDHLQILAETGLPGYVLFLAAVILLVVRASRQRLGIRDPRIRFVRVAVPSITVAFLILCLGQFPLHLVATISTYLFIAAVCAAWSASSEET